MISRRLHLFQDLMQAAVVSIWALYHRNTLICATVKSAIQSFHCNLLLASYLISQIFLLKSILEVSWYLYGALLSNKIIAFSRKTLPPAFLIPLYLQLVAVEGNTVCGGSGQLIWFLPLVLRTNYCITQKHSYEAPTPSDAFLWHPVLELKGKGISLQQLTDLLWSACSRNLLFTGRVPLFIVLGLLMDHTFTGTESHLQFIALTSEMISLSCISLLLIVCYSSQLQPASFRCWAPKPRTSTSCSSLQHLASSFFYVKKYCCR